MIASTEGKGKRLFFKDAFSSEKWELKIEECLKPLESDKKAREIMSDYLDLLLERNYLIQSRAYPAEKYAAEIYIDRS
ncbi:MAG: hypothetical protein QXL78_02075 [Methanocellales archaeon]